MFKYCIIFLQSLRVCKPSYLPSERVCGLKELFGGAKERIVFWRPEICQKIGCKCLPVADVAHEKNYSADRNLSETNVWYYQEFGCA